MKRKFCISDKNGLSIFIFFAVCILLIIFLCAFSMHTTPEKEWFTYTVAEGNTLYGIAMLYCPNDTDWRQWVHEVKKHNGMETDMLFPGDKIEVWTQKEEN